MRKISAAITLGCTLALLAGCEGRSDTAPTPTNSAAPTFVPCTDIPDGVVQSFGGRPETEKKDAADTHIAGYEICSWDTSSWYSVLVISSASEETVRRSPRWLNVATEPVTIGGRQGEKHLEELQGTPYDCSVLFSTTGGGAIVVSVAKRGEQVAQEQLGKRAVEQPCPALEDVAGKISPSLPA